MRDYSKVYTPTTKTKQKYGVTNNPIIKNMP